MAGPTACGTWLGALALVGTVAIGSACAPPYPACRYDKHCKVQQGERCVSEVCQECTADSDCTDESRPICDQLRCVAKSVPSAEPPEDSAPSPCVAQADCEGSLVCAEGTCGPCTDDVQCSPAVCELETGRCASVDPNFAQGLGAVLTDEYRAWLLARWEIALQGNLLPDAYEPCRVGRYCRLRWDVDWQLFDPGSTVVHADPALALMLANGLAEDPSAKLLLVGHAGADENDPGTLALTRAERVRGWLVGEGLDASRIRVKGEGASRPVHVRSAQHTGASERRVELLLSSDASPVGWWPLPRRGTPGAQPSSGRKPAPTPAPAPAPAPAPTPAPAASPSSFPPAPPPAARLHDATVDPR